MDENVPSQTEAEEMCQAFARVTGTDSALALMFLQERNWDIEKSVNDYFELAAKPQTSCDGGDIASSRPLPNRLRIVSWNIDGIDQKNLMSRTTAVAETINREKPHIVYLQEVVPESERILENECPEYQIVCSIEGSSRPDYYTCILLHVETVVMKTTKTVHFSNTQMGRSLHYVQVQIASLQLLCINTHLESTKDCSAERKEQLREAFSQLEIQQPSSHAVFGGDLNIREHEIPPMPSELADLWQQTGERKEALYTWDTSRNHNLNVSYKSRMRFDRLYLRCPLEKGYSGPRMLPVYFELIGLEKVKSCGRFPSDHWGIMVHFDIA